MIYSVPDVAIGSREQFFNEPSDISWLMSTHLKGINATCSSFVLVGNEDSPEAVYLYDDEDPLVTDRARVINLMTLKEAA